MKITFQMQAIVTKIVYTFLYEYQLARPVNTENHVTQWKSYLKCSLCNYHKNNWIYIYY